MKKKILFVASILMIFAMVACAAPAETPAEEAPAEEAAPVEEAAPEEEAAPAEEELPETDSLVVYSPNSEGLLNAVVPLFEEMYGVKVEVVSAGTGECSFFFQNREAMFGLSEQETFFSILKHLVGQPAHP